jgi:hypothetical protein
MMRRKVVKNSDVCYRDRITVLQQYRKQLGTTTKAAQAMGVSLTQASFLMKLAKAPREIQQAIDSFDTTGYGMAFTAWREMANMPAEWQLQQLRSGRTKKSQIHAAVLEA